MDEGRNTVGKQEVSTEILTRGNNSSDEANGSVCEETGLSNIFPGGLEVKASACNVEDVGLIPGLGRSPGEGNGNPLQCSCLENPMDGGAWWFTVHGVTKSRTRLSDFTYLLTYG